LKNDIKLQVHYKPTHLFSYYKKKYKNKKIILKNSEKYYQQELSLPIFFNLKKDIIYKVIQIIKDFTFPTRVR
jgi:perosamine synthetase